ncbi:voltage-dependent calcium channel subunit alpha-2/delta-3 isoform X2 [Apis mellifera]|uniref:Voltage-dependent calcium channel subunit alpha-2/delta-3 isoform X2 n=1 Tax=Apis mellifera TaxID=7460 RepID=A0A7M7H076_APIME|nr:voltage-dependent calcium channel subunit alpha-2/delta-3 isoform X2 [Apis mellifera]|eukprot:XP_006567861.1 voltage-dependent calcium channel subunit alpha-2/delta-3 isoform X2 [Apis mellifera]
MRPRFLPVIVILILTEALVRGDSISYNTVKTWANKLGFELSQLGKFVTNADKFNDSYKQAVLKPRDGNALVHEIAKDIKAMMESKISAIKRIMDVAETSALSAPDVDPPESFNYTNAKNNTIDLKHSAHFGGQVNLDRSAVHVPTNVYDRASNVIRAIKWSEELDKTFINNYEQDPSLSWQYFGSATGFMRQYPAMNWYMEPVDLFDCRTRSWYIEAATSPKDILILIDTSGSMTGIRREIARHVVNNILDTLGNNDFVNIITFSNVTKEVVPCFNDTLVQANLANVRELKRAILNLDTEKIANFSLALTTAFELLETYRTEREGARCNQAIMLITDGVPYNYKEIFETYNWRDNPDEPFKADMPVRMFTYLIGREVADVKEVQWMACANRGYFVHLCTLAEVREEVLKYVPVMARPLVLGRTDHPTIWTPVYADVTDPKMTDWLWEQRESEEQKERFLNLHKRRKLLNSEERDRRFVKKQKKSHDQSGDLQEYRLMTSVSIPVFDRRENANITRQVLVNEAYWVTETRETRIADLLGVAGTDVPIEEIQKLMMPHLLGVNGYAFIVTNNGFILIHPDLRPVFQGILKPAYNSVDMAEVELMDQDKEPREFDEGIIMLRNDVVNQQNGSVTLHTKYHYDDMKRVGRIKRKYDFTGIPKTPFTVIVSLPEHDHTGNYRVHATEEIHRSHVSGINVSDYFAGTNWRVHPHWLYCKYHYEDERSFNSSEAQLLHFLERTRQPRWKWNDMKQPSQPPEYSATNSGNETHRKSKPTPYKIDKDSYYCDRDLLLSLVFDAKVTQWFANLNITREEKAKTFQQRFGVTLAFMATHSGLTRWQDFLLDEEGVIPDDHFSKMYPRAIDEVWYKRAVEQYYVQPESFVFSVPIDEGADNTTLVTASRAIFIDTERAKAPVAVVGFQFQHTALQGLFQNITFSCEGSGKCHTHCGADNWACYLIDNNGYVIAAKDKSDAGKFFGELRGPIMSSLVKEGVFERIRIFDYQAVCFKSTQTSNDGSILLAPWKHAQKMISWLVGQAVWAWAKAGIWESEYAYAYPNEDEDIHEEYQDNDQEKPPITEKLFDQKVLINRTRPEACDQEVYLYLRNASFDMFDIDSDVKKDCMRPYIIQPVNYSNMLLLVVNTACTETTMPPLSVIPQEIIYENNSLVCQKALISLKRKRPQSCIRSHSRESEIKDLCGLASNVTPNIYLFFLLSITCSLIQRIDLGQH